jgi:hypothetical protein
LVTSPGDDPAPRIDIRLSVVLTFDGIATPAAGISMNLSESGVLVQVGREVPRGTRVSLEFKEFKAKGEVIWTKKRESGALLGIRFLTLRGRDRKAVRDLVSLGEG